MVDGWVEWRSRFQPKATPKPIQNLQFRGAQISNFGISGAPVAVPMPANPPQSHSKNAIPEARNQQFGDVGRSRRGLGVVLGAPGESRGVLEGSRGAPGKGPGSSWLFWGDLGGLPGAPGEGPGGSLGVLGGSMEVMTMTNLDARSIRESTAAYIHADRQRGSLAHTQGHPQRPCTSTHAVISTHTHTRRASARAHTYAA